MQCRGSKEQIDAFCRLADILMPNRAAIASLYPDLDADGILRTMYQQYDKPVILSDGTNGSLYIEEGQITHVPAFQLEEVCDTVGAGDAFHGGVVYALEGERIGLIGLNDAGKKNFVDLLLGEQEVTDGQIQLCSRPCEPQSIDQANRCGVYHISRYTKLIDALSLEENMTIMDGSLHLFAHARQTAKLKKLQHLLEEAGFSEYRNMPVAKMPPAQKYLLEVLKAVLLGAKVLLLSDVLYVFDHKEDYSRLLDMLDFVQKKMITVVYISNRFRELLQSMDKVLVLQQGRLIKTFYQDTFSRTALEECLRVSDAKPLPPRSPLPAPQAEIMRVEGLRVGATVCDPLVLYAGEILGIYDDGTFAEVFTTELFGEGEKTARVYVDHKLVSHANYRNLYKHRIGLLHQVADRVYYENMSVRDNLLQMSFDSIGSTLGILHKRVLRYMVKQNQLRLKDLDDRRNLYKLSHRERFRVLLEMNRMMRLRVLTIINPSLYHDPIEAQMIYDYMTQQCKNNGAVFFISSSPTELFSGIADRVVRICKDGTVENIQSISQL